MTTNRSISLTVTLSSNPAVAGRYFADLRDTSPGCNNRQMTTKTADGPEMNAFIATVRSLAAAADAPVDVLVINDAEEEIA